MPAVPQLAPQKVKWNTIRGKILELKNGMTLVPFEQKPGGWLCVIVKSTLKAYPVGGYHIFVTDADVGSAKRIEV